MSDIGRGSWFRGRLQTSIIPFGRKRATASSTLFANSKMMEGEPKEH
jgi:hypothetical protein